MKCLRCEKDHDGSYGSGKYCSVQCANSRGPRTKEFKEKVSKKLKGRKGHTNNRKEREIRQCKKCGSDFKVIITSAKKYCSSQCNPGGYRPRSGHSKSGYYKGIYCGSTYELAWLIHRIDNNLPFERFNGVIEGNDIKYIPDFVDGNDIYEMKGYESDTTVDKKTKLAESKGYNVHILKKDDLLTQFEWVKEHYSFKTMDELYDDYKPKYVYNCHYCGKSIVKQRKAKTKNVFCNRVCAGKGHTGSGNKKGINQYTESP